VLWWQAVETGWWARLAQDFITSGVTHRFLTDGHNLV